VRASQRRDGVGVSAIEQVGLERTTDIGALRQMLEVDAEPGARRILVLR
jgi:hypothetical protein